MSKTVLIKNIRKLATVKTEKGNPLGMVENCNILIKDGIIEDISTETISEKYDKIIDAKNQIALPGFIDCHTHLVFGGNRYDEFENKCAGVSYEEIMKAGGGIQNTVQATRAASKEELIDRGKKYLDQMLSFGVTTCELKSGYGLDTKTEIKILEVIKELSKIQPIELIPTFMGAHDIPPEYKTNRQKYIDLIINEMLPEIAKRKLAEFCDVFCEEGVFTVAESRQIMTKALEYGFKLKIHADEFINTGGAELASEIGAVSAEHLLKISDDGIKELAKSKTTAVLLPGVAFFLNKDYAPARKMIDAGVRVALGTDFNPGSSMTNFLPFMTTLATTKMKMTVSEAIQGITINAAHAIDRQNKIGSIEVGKQADLVLLDIPDVPYFPYHFAVNHVGAVIKKGNVVHEK